MDIKKLNKQMGLPKIVLECESYRLIATSVTEAPRERSERRWIITSVDVNVTLVAERSSVDSLGSIRWTECAVKGMKDSFFDQNINEGLSEPGVKRTKLVVSAKEKQGSNKSV